jgi:tetrahydromethanopterin S-methyltransferase subunit E
MMDWLFEHVVVRDDVGVGTAGGAASQGAVLEIEAKLGRLEDTYTNERIKIPVLTECVVSHLDPSMRIKFISSMTEVSPY